ncbi:aspartate aminotransferase family protein [Clostridium sp.]|uniref:aspartate aminotransferase family protein n=1 Tax=Clostridium sp. TaxID=1506 RepID=UPI001A50051B|nr:aspartate aminotransferase family protein [Clostridium sp.]MBK5241196.1 aspartate aminotransferase family protein [Clostridium sp.]
MNTSLEIEKEQKYLMQNYGRFPVVIERGNGCKLYDVDGKEYIDMTGGIGVSCLGYNNEGIKNALHEQIDKIIHTSNIFYNPTTIELAKQLTQLTKMSKVFFANSGAEANECAIKIARKYGFDNYNGKKNKIITLKESFHGRTITTLTATGQDKYHKYFHPFTEGFKYVEMNNIDEMKEALDDTVCAVMLEAIQGEGGIRPMNKEFAKQVEKLCMQTDTLLIFDEVQSGIGRTGKFFAYESLDVKPDIVTIAKGLGAGVPVGAVLCNSKTGNVFNKGDHGSTFGGSPMAAAAAIEVLKVISKDCFLEEVAKKGAYITEKLKNMNTDKIKEVRGSGLMIGVELNCKVKEILNLCIQKGVLFLSAGDYVVRMLPPLIITYEEIDIALQTLEESINCI